MQQKYHTFTSKVAINTEARSHLLPASRCCPELLFTTPVFANRIDLTLLQHINMAYFDDRVGISSAFSQPKYYGIAAGGNWVTLNGRWQDGELSNSFQPLAADSIIKIIKMKGGGKWKRGGGVKCNCNSSGVGTHVANYSSWLVYTLGSVSNEGEARTHRPQSDIARKISM